MLTFELECRDPLGSWHTVHIVSTDEGDAMIQFRSNPTFIDWHVKSMTQVTESRVIQEYDFVGRK